MSQLVDFIVFDQLKVHNLEVEKRRVRALYTISTSGQSESIEHIFSYDNPYFDRNSYTDINLASMMVAQVALNYGLFCHEIVFDGIYDSADQEFIEEFLENTSREIITNKLLIDNEFIKTEYSHPAIKQAKRYTAATLKFINTRYGHLQDITGVEQKPDYNQYAILSSGGKDSLLTYGLVKEIGVPHPVFINEAGRHWFTAVNSYRYYRQEEPNTVKPWCNSDRVFNWMLKHMKFIKPNYASIRADIYPIRLWTVAVFLFGVIPVARKRNIGNILIGNEFDTTEMASEQGIDHYNGLYDQSIYFDRALTRYYDQKGWHIRQFSLLRPLSELLIMKILVKRYPELQMHQISCHAAHDRDGRMYPCGKCEKCRRIVGMLTALDEDPERCGYSQEQIKHSMNQLASRSVKQIDSDAAHLYHLLVENKNIDLNEFSLRMARAHPEIMQLRIHPERSPRDYMPEEVLKKINKIFNQYSDGAVEYSNGKWQEVLLI